MFFCLFLSNLAGLEVLEFFTALSTSYRKDLRGEERGREGWTGNPLLKQTLSAVPNTETDRGEKEITSTCQTRCWYCGALIFNRLGLHSCVWLFSCVVSVNVYARRPVTQYTFWMKVSQLCGSTLAQLAVLLNLHNLNSLWSDQSRRVVEQLETSSFNWMANIQAFFVGKYPPYGSVLQ